jgi:predicted RNA-binding Zn-ribbon protein involved in translation (DUF1610 family)
MYNKLLKLKETGSARLEYKCDQCGYILYKPLIGDDLIFYIEKWNDCLIFICPSCTEKSMNLSDLWSEEEWISLHKYSEG